jgi:cytochrome c-type biogenesis protein CcmH
MSQLSVVSCQLSEPRVVGGINANCRIAQEQKFFGSFFQKRTFLLPFFLLFSFEAFAVSDPREMLPDPQQEARAEAIGSQLRCLVCQNESIEESNAGLAADLRAKVREQVKAGRSNAEIMAWMVARYGNFVRLRPPLTAATFLLYATPFLALLAGGAAAWFGRTRQSAPPSPLTEAEQAKLAELSRPHA